MPALRGAGFRSALALCCQPQQALCPDLLGCGSSLQGLDVFSSPHAPSWGLFLPAGSLLLPSSNLGTGTAAVGSAPRQNTVAKRCFVLWLSSDKEKGFCAQGVVSWGGQMLGRSLCICIAATACATSPQSHARNSGWIKHSTDLRMGEKATRSVSSHEQK